MFKQGTGLAMTALQQHGRVWKFGSLGIFHVKSDPTDHQTRSTHAHTPTPSLRNWDGSRHPPSELQEAIVVIHSVCGRVIPYPFHRT